MIHVGIDVGSLWIKIVVLKDKKILGWSIVPTGEECEASVKNAMDELLAGNGILPDSVTSIVTTGAGRKEISFADAQANEVVCAARGIRFLDPEVQGVIDMGAECTRVVKLDNDGEILDYSVNDKCASGTGIFLDAIGKVMGVPVEEMGPRSLESKNDIEINSTCVVFAESEVVSQVHKQTPKEDILKGLHKSIATRIHSLSNRVGLEGHVMAIGGLSRNIGIIRSLEDMMKKELKIPENPQLVSALGAAIVAIDKGGSI